MLVLSRKRNESIKVDGPCEIHVVRVKGDTVRLGIRAGDDVKIIRSEIELRDLIEGEKAATQAA